MKWFNEFVRGVNRLILDEQSGLKSRLKKDFSRRRVPQAEGYAVKKIPKVKINAIYIKSAFCDR